MLPVCHTTAHRTPEQRMLDGARDSILAVGFRRSTLTDVARRAGVSRMTLYRRWPDMASLVADLLTREWEELLAGLELDQVSARARAVHAVVSTAAALRTNPVFRRVLDVDPELLLPYVLDRRGRSQDLALDLLHDLVRDGQHEGSVRSGNPHVLARSALLTAYGFTLSLPTMVEPGRGAVCDYETELALLLDRYLAP